MFNQKHRYFILSKWVLIKHGVPQDSVPGPLLFRLHVNDLSNFIIINLYLFCFLMIQVYTLLTLTLLNLMQILI